MNLYIKLLFAIMILYTFYNFYMDFRSVIKGGNFMEGNQNMGDVPPDDSAGAPSGANCNTTCHPCINVGERKNCARQAQQFGNVPMFDSVTGNLKHTGVQWCKNGLRSCTPNSSVWDTYNFGDGTGAGAGAGAAATDDAGSAADDAGTGAGAGAAAADDAGTDAAAVTGADTDTGVAAGAATADDAGADTADDAGARAGAAAADGPTQEQIDIAVAEAMADSEVKSLTQKIFDKFKVSYNNSLSKQQLKDFLRQIDDQNLPPEGIEFAAAMILALIDFNKNDKVDFNEMLLILLDMKKTQNIEFKRIQNIFSPSYSNNNNNNNNYQTLPNGNIVLPATGTCPNGCKMPNYDSPNCENTLHNGKSYRQCPWSSVESSHDCGKCGAVLLPKNEHGYAKTQIGYSDVRSLEIISKRIERQRMESKKQLSRSEFFNIGKEFLKQHGELKGYDVPDNITVKEYTLLGKILFIYLANKTQKNQSTLKNYIDSLYLEHYLNNKCDNCENMAESSVDEETKFTLEELKKRDAYAYTEGIVETGSDNRLGGSKSQYDNRTAYRSNYKPADPRKFPNPYNSMWDIFSTN